MLNRTDAPCVQSNHLWTWKSEGDGGGEMPCNGLALSSLVSAVIFLTNRQNTRRKEEVGMSLIYLPLLKTLPQSQQLGQGENSSANI